MQVQSELMAQDRLYQMQNVKPVDPFDSIFERSGVSREDIPGFATNSHRNTSGLGDSFSTVKGGNNGNAKKGHSNNNGNSMMPATFTPEALPMDTIKAKISARRNRNPSIRAQARQAEAMAQSMMRGMNLDESGDQQQQMGYYEQYQEQEQQYHRSSKVDYNSYRRRSIDMVGEVNEFSVQDQGYDDSEKLTWDYSGYYGEDTMSAQMSLAGYSTNNLPRYRNDDVKSIGVSVASGRGRGYDEQTLGSIPYDLSSTGVRLATYRRTSLDGK